jgi:hypothetical protein
MIINKKSVPTAAGGIGCADGGRRHSSTYADGNYVPTAILLVYFILVLCRWPRQIAVGPLFLSRSASAISFLMLGFQQAINLINSHGGSKESRDFRSPWPMRPVGVTIGSQLKP